MIGCGYCHQPVYIYVKNYKIMVGPLGDYSQYDRFNTYYCVPGMTIV